ncbi:hypothetical protein DV735_g680, partial [Chaetothyriales sp. CBS 134920]
MRPLRLILLVFFFVALPVFLTTWSIFSHADPAAQLRAGYPPYASRLTALFSFSAPSTLFPPSAIISLTYDNSTFFLARPAAFGPLLPAKGLSGQLWVGRGFGDEAALADHSIHTTGWEFGCSDVPDWQEWERKEREGQQAPTVSVVKPHSATDAEAENGQNSHSNSHSNGQPDLGGDGRVDDGTDDYLHSPLQDSNPAVPGKPGEPANAPVNKPQKPTHADIESLQESADIAGKIVLLARGGCGFHEKVKWAQRRGAIAVIVGEREKGGPLTSMYAKGDTSNVTIPSIFTTYNAAHLLASLAPETVSGPDDSARLDREAKNGKAAAAGDKPVFTSTAVPLRSGNVAAKSLSPSPSPALQQPDWMKDALSAIGLSDPFPWHAEDSRRPPGSGNIKWILQEDWDEHDPTRTKLALPSRPVSRAVTSAVLSKAKSTSTRRSEDDFVIGVQDWRDTELIAPKPTTTASSSRAGGAKSTPAPWESGPKKPVETALQGGSITPGSGEYDRGQDEDVKRSLLNPVSAKQDGGHQDGARRPWYCFLLREKACPESKASQPKSHIQAGTTPAKKANDGPDEQDGLWVTLTPTSLSTSPLFDTLLVLVISPLITLTVVYALLLLRSRIRRRRWRAPKSVVDRLPVRTYHTMSATSSTTSSQASSPDHSHSTSPTLQAVNNRSRPRSHTTTALLGSSPDSILSLGSTPPTEKAGSKARPKRFHGRQVECVVCLEEYVDGESRVMSLPCGHEFHAECITPWLVNRRRTCPICKRDVVRSMNRSGRLGHGREQRSGRDSTTDRVQGRAGSTADDDDNPRSALSTPSRDDETDDDDLERGDDATIPLLGGGQPLGQQSSWRNVMGRTFNRLGGDYAQTQTPHRIDRTR